MRSSQLGEITIKVPAPFAGISDLGFSAQYRAQRFNEPQRDVPLLIEGPPSPMRRLAEHLRLLHASDESPYAWTYPVLLSDEALVLAFRDRSLERGALSDGAPLSDYMLNLIRPVVFPFLHDCAAIAHLKLSRVIEMRVSAQAAAVAQMELRIDDIVEPNGDRFLWSAAG